MKEVKDDLLLLWYYKGYELSSNNQDFPNLFETYIEKYACLLGYQDFDISVVRDKDEIMELINENRK